MDKSNDNNKYKNHQYYIVKTCDINDNTLKAKKFRDYYKINKAMDWKSLLKSSLLTNKRSISFIKDVTHAPNRKRTRIEYPAINGIDNSSMLLQSLSLSNHTIQEPKNKRRKIDPSTILNMDCDSIKNTTINDNDKNRSIINALPTIKTQSLCSNNNSLSTSKDKNINKISNNSNANMNNELQSIHDLNNANTNHDSKQLTIFLPYFSFFFYMSVC